MSHEELFLRLHPAGFDLDEGSFLRIDLGVAGWGLDAQDTQTDALALEMYPDGAEQLLASWERVYDIHRISGRSTAERRERVLYRRKLVPNMLPSTMEAALEDYTSADWTIIEPFAFRCDDAASVCDTTNDVVDGGLTFFAQADRADVSAFNRKEMQEIIDLVKPAHVVGRLQFVGFITDDPLSLTDFDLLGA
ncbi:MAG TPA: DUF2313 domain-containing protein [Myxococcota bacterium]|nr:DUF2313 domain-containing protein [Myxococcota bacterium]